MKGSEPPECSKTIVFGGDPIRPLYPCIILIKGSHDPQGQATERAVGGETLGLGDRGEGGRGLLEFYCAALSRILPCGCLRGRRPLLPAAPGARRPPLLLAAAARPPPPPAGRRCCPPPPPAAARRRRPPPPAAAARRCAIR